MRDNDPSLSFYQFSISIGDLFWIFCRKPGDETTRLYKTCKRDRASTKYETSKLLFI